LLVVWAVGAVAQLGEHLLCKQGVTGSIPVSSTNQKAMNWLLKAECLVFQVLSFKQSPEWFSG
jgi:hypothetical protein